MLFGFLVDTNDREEWRLEREEGSLRSESESESESDIDHEAHCCCCDRAACLGLRVEIMDQGNPHEESSTSRVCYVSFLLG